MFNHFFNSLKSEGKLFDLNPQHETDRYVIASLVSVDDLIVVFKVEKIGPFAIANKYKEGETYIFTYSNLPIIKIVNQKENRNER